MLGTAGSMTDRVLDDRSHNECGANSRRSVTAKAASAPFLRRDRATPSAPYDNWQRLKQRSAIKNPYPIPG
jgi:hypothetical protein